MQDFEKKTVNEWLKSINGRCDWCYKPERRRRSKPATPSIEFLHDDLKSGDSFDRNRAKFLSDLEMMMN